MGLKERYRKIIDTIDNRLHLGVPLSLIFLWTSGYDAAIIEAGRCSLRPSTVIKYYLEPASIFYSLGVNQINTSELEKALENSESIDSVRKFRDKMFKSGVEVGGFLFLDENVLRMYEIENPKTQEYNQHEELVKRINGCSEEQFSYSVNEYYEFMKNVGFDNTLQEKITEKFVSVATHGRKRLNSFFVKSGKEKVPLMDLVFLINREILSTSFTPGLTEYYQCYENNTVEGKFVGRFHFHPPGIPPSDSDIQMSEYDRILVFSLQQNGFDMYDIHRGNVSKIEWRKT